MAALRYRAATGRGQLVELSQGENVMAHLGDMFVDQQFGVEPRRVGNRHARHAPQGLYPCLGENRWIAVSVPDNATWRALAEATGSPELGEDPRFAEGATRAEHHDDLDRILSAWTSSREMMDAFHLLQRAGVPAGPLLDDELLTADPHLAARGWFRPLDSGDMGSYLHPGLAFTGVPHAWRRGSPTLGEDNEYVYQELLGVSDEDYRRFTDERLLATDYLQPDGTPY
jgi:crotonobetainyl-CoA:carnitine CoA-transferase CaiB-like acyl-CoA transferase